MGFLSKLFGRTKDMATDVKDVADGAIDKAGDVVEKVVPDSIEDKVDDVVDKAKDVSDDAIDKVTGRDDTPSSPSSS